MSEALGAFVDSSTFVKPAQPDHIQPGNLAMLVGFALFQAWVTLCFFTPQLFPANTGANHVYEISLAVSAAVLMLGAVFHRRLDPLLRKGSVLWCLAGAAAAGTAIVPLCFGTGTLQTALTAVASLLTGTASGLFNVAWCQAFVRRGSAIDFTLSVVTSSVIIYVLTNIAYTPAVSPFVMLALSIATPLASAALLCLHGPDVVERVSMAVPVNTKQRRLFLLQLCVGIFVVSLADEFMRNYYLEGTDLSFYSSQINLIILVFKVVISIMAVTAIYRMRYEDFSFLYRASFLLALVAALLMPFTQSTGAVGYAIANCGAFLFKLTVLLVSLEFCAQGAPATRTFCIIRAVWSLDLLLGYGLYGLLGGRPLTGLEPGALTVVFVVLVAIAYLFVFSPDREHGIGQLARVRDRSTATAGNSAEKVAAAAAPAAGDAAPTPVGGDTDQAIDFDAVCERLVEQGGLSPREADVLRLLVRGRTTARIQNELHISANTVNTHVRHVFQKLDVHSRQELLDLAEETANMSAL